MITFKNIKKVGIWTDPNHTTSGELCDGSRKFGIWMVREKHIDFAVENHDDFIKIDGTSIDSAVAALFPNAEVFEWTKV